MTKSHRRNKGKQAHQEEPPSVDITEKEETMPESKDGISDEKNETEQQVNRKDQNANATAAAAAASSKDTPQPHQQPPPPPPPSTRGTLVLTSGKRRGIYECDYCHSDISQVPRIQCANCPEFDLCLDCFATTDHSAAIARLKARGQVHDAVVSTIKSGVSAAAAHHDCSHGYRVADSTRYPLFPAVRAVVKPSASSDTTDTATSIEKKDDAESSKSDSPPLKKLRVDDEGSSKAESPDAMEIDTQEKKTTTAVPEAKEVASQEHQDKPITGAPSTVKETEAKTGEKSQYASPSELMVLPDDPKSIWTVEEDLRLLDAIETCGMGNWVDIAEAIQGNGSSNKTAKRCMERYFDDFLGRYGHILPPFTFVQEDSDDGEQKGNEDVHETHSDTDLAGSAKRRRVERPLFRSQSVMSTMSNVNIMKKAKVVPTPSLPGYDKIWPDPYIPPTSNAAMDQQVGRDLTMKAEYQYVKTIGNAESKAEVDKIRKEWMEANKDNKYGPTVFPPRTADTAELPGAELAGYMPRRGDFDMEWDNDAETILADMEFSPDDLPQDRQLKIQVIEIYNAKLDERERRKNFLLSRNLTDYRRNQQADAKLPRDERDLVRRMRLFERLHTPEEHKQFIADLLKAKRLRKEIAKLQMYRRMGIRTMAEAERYELDKSRREYHKAAQVQKELEIEKAKQAAARVAAAKEADVETDGGGDGVTSTGAVDYESITSSSSLWKQYKANDRSNRRSINRGSSSISITSVPSASGESNAGSPAKEENDANAGENKAEAGKPQAEGTESAENKVSETNGEPMEVEVHVSEAQSKPEAVVEADDKKDVRENKSDDKQNATSFDITSSRGYKLLTKNEVGLCERLQLLPAHYLEIKKALIEESLTRGLLDREGNASHKRAIVKIDAEKRGDVIDFMVRAGWISTSVGASSA